MTYDQRCEMLKCFVSLCETFLSLFGCFGLSSRVAAQSAIGFVLPRATRRARRSATPIQARRRRPSSPCPSTDGVFRRPTAPSDRGPNPQKFAQKNT
jgi:hypothetical protein